MLRGPQVHSSEFHNIRGFTDPLKLGHDSRPGLKTIVFLPRMSSHFSSVSLLALLASDLEKVPMPVEKPFLRTVEATQSFLHCQRTGMSLDKQSPAIFASTLKQD